MMWRQIASITFAGGPWWWVALGAAVVLVPLAVLAARPAGKRTGTMAVALALRTLGIGLLLVCLLDPQWTSPRAKRGANFFAVLADNSRSLQITDAGATGTRGAQIRNALTGPDSHWLATLAEQYQLRPYVFDRDLRRVQDFSQLDFQGESSALGAALRDVRERFAGQPLAGVLLFTDGDATDLAGGLPDLSGLPPVYPIVVGRADGLRDVRLARVDVRQTAFDDAPVSVHAEIAGQDASGRDLAVKVLALNAPALKPNEADSLPALQTVRLFNNTQTIPVTFDWKPRGAGVQFYDVSVAATGPLPFEEATLANNHRVVLVDRGRPAYRILYVAGRPNWEFKFLNRALEDDPQLQMVGLIRIAKREPKFEFIGRNGEAGNPLFSGFSSNDDTQSYDQPVLRVVNARDEKELRAGFPQSAEELYAYDAVVLDDVEAQFFTADQLALLRRFAAERGGGLLLLGGADTMESGGYLNTPLANAMPVYLDRKAAALPQGELVWNLTREGWLEPWTRVRAVEADERTRLGQMPHLEVANALSGIKPGATVLATVTDQARHVYPALIAQNYGAGRVACVAVGDLWRWGMQGETEMADLSHFWRQLARWLVTNVPAPVELKAVPPSAEQSAVTLQVTARDREFRPLDLGTARVTVKRVNAIAGAPGFEQVTLPAEPVADAPGQFAATFTPREAGSYLAEAEVTDRAGKVIGHAQAGWVNDPSLEEFQSLAPNRPLLEELARRTGGEVMTWSQLNQLASLLPKRSAPITEESSQPLWQQSGVFLAVLLCFLAEWAWRRWKGLP